jgi:hypothetical protein
MSRSVGSWATWFIQLLANETPGLLYHAELAGYGYLDDLRRAYIYA